MCELHAIQWLHRIPIEYTVRLTFGSPPVSSQALPRETQCVVRRNWDVAVQLEGHIISPF